MWGGVWDGACLEDPAAYTDVGEPGVPTYITPASRISGNTLKRM